MLPAIVTNPTIAQLTFINGSWIWEISAGRLAMLREYKPKVIRNIPPTIRASTLNISAIMIAKSIRHGELIIFDIELSSR
jgi:hypothetical protein